MLHPCVIHHAHALGNLLLRVLDVMNLLAVVIPHRPLHSVHDVGVFPSIFSEGSLQSFQTRVSGICVARKIPIKHHLACVVFLKLACTLLIPAKPTAGLRYPPFSRKD